MNIMGFDFLIFIIISLVEMQYNLSTTKSWIQTHVLFESIILLDDNMLCHVKRIIMKIIKNISLINNVSQTKNFK